MLTDKESSVVLTLHTALTDTGQSILGNREALTLTDQLLAFASATVTICDSAVRVESYDAAGERLISYELEEAVGAWRHGRYVEHKAGVVSALRVPAHKVAPASWLLPQEEAQELCFYLGNGTLLRGGIPLDFRVNMPEVRTFWSDLFWLQPEDNSADYWERLANFGLPQQVSLEDLTTGAVLVEIVITAVARRAPGVLDLEGCRVADPASLRGVVANEPPAPGAKTQAFETGSGEHIGWIITPGIIEEIQQQINEIGKACGEFDQHDIKEGGLIIDWYDRASNELGANQLNAFTRVREVLKSVIAMYILPSEVNKGEIPPEMKDDYGQWLKNIFADKKVPANQRWCTFLNGLKQSPPEFYGKQPTDKDHHDHREKILHKLVYDTLQQRYAKPINDRPEPYSYSCWAFDFDARNFKVKLRPGSQLIKALDVTAKGLRLEIAIDRITADFEYETQPSGSAGNVALCLLTFGGTNIAEIQFGDATIVAEDVLLSLDLIPTQVDKQIKLEAKLGDNSHAKLIHHFRGSNIFTLGMAEVLSLIFSLMNKYEEDLLDDLAGYVEDFIADLDLSFPALFNFEDAPAPVLETAVVVSNPGKAQLMGAQLRLPADRAPTPLPALTMPACKGDFAITLANDYLNGVLAHRLFRFKQTAKVPYFDWKQYVKGASLPDVALPKSYKPPAEGGKYPTDYEADAEEWTFGTPIFKPAPLAALPDKGDAIGTIQIPITYRLTRTHYAWGGAVRVPVVAPDWWRKGLKEPLGPEPVSRGDLLIDLDNIMTARYGSYRQADGQVVSLAPAGLAKGVEPNINPSPGWHAVDVGGVIIEWFPYAVATDEHINVQMEATLPAHLNLAELSPSFLPALDLTYGALQIALKKASYSASFPGLENQPELFLLLAESYLQPFAALHTFQKNFQHSYWNLAWLLCGSSYSPFLPQKVNPTGIYLPFVLKETPVNLLFTVNTMLDEADPTKLHIEQDGTRLKVTFRFLEQFAG